MPKINILSPFVADLIAAGEVVERPASVVKELFENAVDAGARNITVEIRSGGSEYIRVTDDGCGMAPEDAGVAFLRHATSKLRDERGLEAIGTLGFRGEALAAIGSVARVELLTRERGAESGTRVLLEGGDILDMGEFGCPEGTTLIVRGLFFNTPARQKFMKSDRSEGTACAAAALHGALGHPELSVRCIRDGKEEFFTPGDGRAESCAYSLLGRETAASLLPVAVDDGGLAVTGFVSSPAAGRGSRAHQYFFCNGRVIKSQLLQAAVEQAYKNTLLTGRFPACVVYVSLGFGAVDVNVHPAKTEVKFSDEKRVFDAVHYAVRGALDGESVLSAAPAVPAPRPGPAPEPEPAPLRAPAIRQPALHYQTRMDLPAHVVPPPGRTGLSPHGRKHPPPPCSQRLPSRPARCRRSGPRSRRRRRLRSRPRRTRPCGSSAKPWAFISWSKKATRSS
jgi:DNA mismatch repair protein MutL